ncbi:thioesterase II family protein [Streptosporangium lutulentum]
MATRTLVCLPYGGGSAAAYRPLVAELARTSPTTAVLAVELPGHDPARPNEAMLSMTELTDRLVAELAEVSGPIALYGHCVGSAAATELALRLEASGKPVAASSSAAVSPTHGCPDGCRPGGTGGSPPTAGPPTAPSATSCARWAPWTRISAIPRSCCAACGMTSGRHRPGSAAASAPPPSRSAGSRRRCCA